MYIIHLLLSVLYFSTELSRRLVEYSIQVNNMDHRHMDAALFQGCFKTVKI